MSLPHIAAAAAGVLLNLVVLRDVFHSLFYPSGRGTLMISVFRLVWAATGGLGDRARSLAGPLAMVGVIALWVGTMVLGWTLIYMPGLPDSFIFASSLDPVEQAGLVDALYYAWVTQSTLGYGDYSPATPVLRVLAPLQATLGFGLFTLVATWVLSVYPALQRQRAAASLAHALRLSYERSGTRPADVHPATLARQLERLTQALHAVRTDLVQYPATFYFAAPRSSLSLADGLDFVGGLARADGYGSEARPAAAELGASLELLAQVLGDQYLDMGDADLAAVLRAYRAHHGGDDAAVPSGA